MNERRKTATIFGYSHRHDAALTLRMSEAMRSGLSGEALGRESDVFKTLVTLPQENEAQP